MGTVQEWLEDIAKTNKSSEDDSRKMQSLLHKVGFGNAVVVYGVVYPEGRGRPVSIHAMAKEILSSIPAKKKGEWAKEHIYSGNVYSPDYIRKNEVYTGKRTFRDVNERNEKARELRKDGWKVKSFSYSDFCGFDAVRERSEKKGEWAKRTKYVAFPAGKSSKTKHKSKRTISKASKVR
jgi:hypothetical protein